MIVKSSEKVVTSLLILFLIFKIFTRIIEALWSMFLKLLDTISSWIDQHPILLICIILISILILWGKYFMRNIQSSAPAKPIIQATNITEKEQHDANVNNYFQVRKDPVIARTIIMVDKLNEMLKSKRHRKENINSYTDILKRNGYGYVYFIKVNNGTTKIGKANNPLERIEQIYGHVNSSIDINVIHLIRSNDPLKTENSFHDHFTKKRFINQYDPTEKNEYFHLDNEDLAWIKRQIYPEPIQQTIKY